MLKKIICFGLTFAFGASGLAATAAAPADELASARLNLARLQAEAELNKLSSGLSVKEALRTVATRPDDAAFWAKFMASHKLSPLETIRFGQLRAIPQGWEFQVPGLAGRTKFRLDERAKLSVNGREIDPSLPARELYQAVNAGLVLKPTHAANLFWDALVPRAEANPVVILPALATLGLVAAVQGIAWYTKDAPGEVLERYFRDAEALCEKERGAKLAFDKSETFATKEKIVKAGVVHSPAKVGDCEVFAANFKRADREKLLVGNATRACKAADDFLACADAYRGKPKRSESPKASEGSSQMNVK